MKHPDRTSLRGGFIVSLALLLGGRMPAVLACDIPVFRFALQQWRPSSYRIVVFHEGVLSASDQTLVQSITDECTEGKGFANATIESADVKDELGADLKPLWDRHGAAKTPWVVVTYPSAGPNPNPGGDAGADPNAPIAWSGALNAENISQLKGSPVRKEIAKRILSGTSAVWVMLDSGEQARDDAAFKDLQTSIQKLQKTMQLPKPVAGNLSLGITGKTELKLEFAVVRIPKDAADEQVTRAMLMNWNTEAAKWKGPLVVPVFGRGRALAVLHDDGLKDDTLGDVAGFLLGACSCETKEANPGMDMLMSVDWDSLLNEDPAVDRATRVVIPDPVIAGGSTAGTSAGSTTKPK